MVRSHNTFSLALFALVSVLLAAPTSAWHYYYQTSGCGKAGLNVDSTGHLNRTLPSGRQYLLHVPKEYNNSIAHPLVLSFHGANGNSFAQEKLSQFSTPGLLIAGLPIIAAYPQGVQNTTANRTATWRGAPYANTTVDDVQFVKDIVQDLATNYCLAPTRYYASGKSNGGSFTATLACLPETSKLFAAFAPVSPALYPETYAFSGCHASRPIPIINSHGVEDTTIPYKGRNDSATKQYGVGDATINVDLWRRQWAVRNGCFDYNNTGNGALPAIVDSPYPNATRYDYQCNAEFIGFTVKGLGHSWPTTQGLDASGAPNNTASFNLTIPSIVDFFSRNALPPAYL